MTDSKVANNRHSVVRSLIIQSCFFDTPKLLEKIQTSKREHPYTSQISRVILGREAPLVSASPRGNLRVPPLGSFAPSLGILSSLRGDFEIPPLGFFRPALGGRFSSHQNGTAVPAIMQRRTTTRDPYRSLLVRFAALRCRIALEPPHNLY